MIFFTHIFSRWPEVDEKLFPLALILFGFDPESKIQRESRRTWEEDWKAARQLYLPCRGTTSFPPEIPSSSIWLPTWNSDTLKPWNPGILPTREKLILRMYKVKVAVVGPSQAGKTMISNFLADATENIGGDISASVFVLCKLFCFWNGNKALLQGSIDQQLEFASLNLNRQVKSCNIRWHSIHVKCLFCSKGVK